jgi:hypothetical protein
VNSVETLVNYSNEKLSSDEIILKFVNVLIYRVYAIIGYSHISNMRLIIKAVNLFQRADMNNLLATYRVDLSRIYVHVTQKYLT